MAADVSAALAKSLRVAIRDELLGSWALTSLPAAYTAHLTPQHGVNMVLDVLSSMKDCMLADVLQHMHLSELLYCPKRLRAVALASRGQKGSWKMRQQLAWHPECRTRCPPSASSYLSEYAQDVQQLQVCRQAPSHSYYRSFHMTVLPEPSGARKSPRGH
jgi:hypothetical protein